MLWTVYGPDGQSIAAVPVPDEHQSRLISTLAVSCPTLDPYRDTFGGQIDSGRAVWELREALARTESQQRTALHLPHSELAPWQRAQLDSRLKSISHHRLFGDLIELLLLASDPQNTLMVCGR